MKDPRFRPPARRCTIKAEDLPSYIQNAERKGFKVALLKSADEAIRMTRKGTPDLVVYFDSPRQGILRTTGTGADMYMSWLSKNPRKKDESQRTLDRQPAGTSGAGTSE